MLPNSSSLTKLLVDAHIEELRRAAARSPGCARRVHDCPPPERTSRTDLAPVSRRRLRRIRWRRWAT